MIEYACSPGKSVSLEEGLIIKKSFSSKRALEREVAGLRMFIELVPEYVPALVGLGDTFVLEECIIGCQWPNLSTEAGVYIGLNIGEELKSIVSLLWERSTLRTQKLYKLWETGVRALVTNYRSCKEVMVGLPLGGRLYEKICRDLEVVQANYLRPRNVTFTHRDLHYENVINDGITLKLIDFEHSMSGPLELEFQNAIFWSDEKSLDYRKILKEVTTKTGIDYDMKLEKLLLSFYVADQLILANEAGDKDKMVKIVGRFCELRAL